MRWSSISQSASGRGSSSPTSARELLGTGGGIAKALPKLGDAPFFLINADTFWLDGVKPNFSRLAEAFDAATMDALLLLAATAGSIGYEGRGDYAMLPDGQLRRRGEQRRRAVHLCRRGDPFARHCLPAHRTAHLP